ncbi:50S ribosomal protein L29 [Candidatus Uhrbacteria bacterium CG_4_10_14_0_8_um_filter_58_22]|uniref:Large ribosomal subunit protein uL29 n=1 Tax=Candidatus Uhrbacteria bacterium CG_4_10_14_0_8_um_filter_58_22 TaxID=1975029 RepID=A0A2M7QAM9_9BACT|nr:MAG: 50S ribosomal protein L29 [Parcubacteria group bacterium CG1_02_58_44]PIY62397.1 MAG: 50S ribosomal protein L29 [Candidatus Uhrbacteria bacterium CG_4_10_14_0_8_um_filter_58_22]
MKMNEMKEKSDVELGRLLAELQSQMQDRRFAAVGRRLTRVRELRTIRKDIARILSIRHERTLSGNGEAAVS